MKNEQQLLNEMKRLIALEKPTRAEIQEIGLLGWVLE